MTKKPTPSKYGLCLANSWNLEQDLKELPESELKSAIVEWAELSKIGTGGAMNFSGIIYRGNLQCILENLGKVGLIDEIKEQVVKFKTRPNKPAVDKIRLLKQFRDTFKVDPMKYYNPILGFDVVKFDDEIVKPPDGVSTKEAVGGQWGKPAVELIQSLL